MSPNVLLPNKGKFSFLHWTGVLSWPIGSSDCPMDQREAWMLWSDHPILPAWGHSSWCWPSCSGKLCDMLLPDSKSTGGRSSLRFSMAEIERCLLEAYEPVKLGLRWASTKLCPSPRAPRRHCHTVSWCTASQFRAFAQSLGSPSDLWSWLWEQGPQIEFASSTLFLDDWPSRGFWVYHDDGSFCQLDECSFCFLRTGSRNPTGPRCSPSNLHRMESRWSFVLLRFPIPTLQLRAWVLHNICGWLYPRLDLSYVKDLFLWGYNPYSTDSCETWHLRVEQLQHWRFLQDWGRSSQLQTIAHRSWRIQCVQCWSLCVNHPGALRCPVWSQASIFRSPCQWGLPSPSYLSARTPQCQHDSPNTHHLLHCHRWFSWALDPRMGWRSHFPIGVFRQLRPLCPASWNHASFPFGSLQ